MCTVAAGVTAAAMAYQYDQTQKAQGDAEAAAQQQQAQAQGQQNLINQQVANVNSQFGVGSDIDAIQNSQRINNTINANTNATMAQGDQSLDNNLLSSITAERVGAGRAGMLGTGTDQANQSQYLSDYLQGKQQLAANAQTQAQQELGQLDQQRNSLASQIASQGGMANPFATNYLAQQSLALGQAGAQQPMNTALSGLFNAGAGLTTANAQAVGSGQPGAAGMFGASSSSQPISSASVGAAGGASAGAGTSTAIPLFFGS